MIYRISWTHLATTMRTARNASRAMLLVTAFAFVPAGYGVAGDRDDDTIRVMTRNLYFGADLGPIVQAVS